MFWLVAIIAWQYARNLSQHTDAETIAKSHVAAGLRAKAAIDMCAACHTLTFKENRIGPPLVDLIGKNAGTEPGFAYTEAMRKSGIVWNSDTLRKFLLDPQGTVPGTAMGISGMAAEDVQAVIEYLENQ